MLSIVIKKFLNRNVPIGPVIICLAILLGGINFVFWNVVYSFNINPDNRVKASLLFLVTDRVCVNCECGSGISFGTLSLFKVTTLHIPINGQDPNILRAVHCSGDNTLIRYNQENFITAIKYAMTPSRRTRRPVTIAIYGYNTTVSGAILTTKDLTDDLKLHGPVLVYSWPSQGEIWPWSYRKDLVTVNSTNADLAHFLMLLNNNHINNINIIIHSMGAIAISQALQSNAFRPRITKPIYSIALAAPDLGEPEAALALRVLLKYAHYLDIYVSNKDYALKLSAAANIWPGPWVSRLGSGKQFPRSVNDITKKDLTRLRIIDASQSSCEDFSNTLLYKNLLQFDISSLFGHGYYLTRPIYDVIAESFSTDGTPGNRFRSGGLNEVPTISSLGVRTVTITPESPC